MARSLNPSLRLLANIAVSVLILAVGVGGLIVFGRRPEIVTTDAADAKDKGVFVRTAGAVAWDSPLEIEVDGEAMTSRVLTVGSEVTGRIANKPSTNRGGLYVRAGEILFEIDPQDYKLEVQRLQAELSQAQAELESVDVELASHRALLELAQEDQRLQDKNLQRMISLQDRNAATESEIDLAIKQELTARNAVQSLQNQIDVAKQQKVTRQAKCALVAAQLEQAKLDLSRCTVRSPIDGRIVDDLVEQGDFVRPGDELLHLSDSSQMEVKCSLGSDEVAWIWQQHAVDPEKYPPPDLGFGDPLQLPPVECEVLFDFQGTTTGWNGYLSRYEGTGLDRETRMFPCRIVVDDPVNSYVASSPGGHEGISPPTLLSGMYVTVRIPVKSKNPLVQVPVQAVRPGERIWVIRDNELRIMPCRPAQTTDEFALVRSDISGVVAGDQVVVSPLAAVYDGMAVSIVDEEAQP